MKKPQLEIWAGIECTVNRVRDTYFDQLESNGHFRRPEDIEAFAKIGLKVLRYPFLWEHIAPHGVDSADWTWSDERIPLLEKHGIKPIAGLTHHGSGPRYTNLLDPRFPEKLAEYAGAFARRYPQIDRYTPINEAFTTARFSCLYGHWYPHTQDFLLTMHALMNECKGTILSMREIRKVNPKAELIQTDDLGRASSTAAMKEEAEFQNERRWLGFDLLCGKMNSKHPLWNRLLEIGVMESDLKWFEENACPPDIVGVNTYPLSNRYLDEDRKNYLRGEEEAKDLPGHADVASVHVAEAEQVSQESLLRETWERYHLPVAITEVHIDAGREDQVRWLMECWNAAKKVREEGADIRAITAWGLLGHFDWNCLCTECRRYYESGVFDLRGPEPRATALAHVIKSLAETGDFQHPVLSTDGWWKRSTRVQYPKPVEPPKPYEMGSFAMKVEELASSALGAGAMIRTGARRKRPLLIRGSLTSLGREFARACEARGVPYYLLNKSDLNVCDTAKLEEFLNELNPWALVNTADNVRIDEAELNPKTCYVDTVLSADALAQACARRDLQFLTFSSDLVFNGNQDRPYLESDLTSPINVFGKSNVQAEDLVLKAYEKALVIRRSAIFSPDDSSNFLNSFLKKLEQGKEVLVPTDIKVSLSYAPELVNTAMNLLMDRECGIWHLANSRAVTWEELAKEAASMAKLPERRVVGVTTEALSYPAPRPKYSALSSERGNFLRPLDQALSSFFEQRVS